MEVHFEKLLEQVTKFMETEARSETVIGKEFKLGEFTCIPIISLGMGFGTGGGGAESVKHDHGEGAGIVSGMGIQPIGFLVTRADQISFIGTKTNKGLAAAFEKVPDLLEKFLETRKTKEEVLN